MLIFVSLNLNNTLGETVLVMSFCSLGHFCPTVLTISSVAGQGVAEGAGQGKDGVLRSGVAQQ